MNYMISQEFHEKSKVYTSPDILKLLKLHVLFDADFDFLQYLSSDIAELQKRQTIFKDLIRHPSLAEQLGRLFDLLQTVDAMNFKADEKPTDLFILCPRYAGATEPHPRRRDIPERTACQCP